MSVVVAAKKRASVSKVIKNYDPFFTVDSNREASIIDTKLSAIIESKSSVVNNNDQKQLESSVNNSQKPPVTKSFTRRIYKGIKFK